MERARILVEVERYYSSKLSEYGAQARGVDWPTPESQELRFRQLLKVCGEPPFSLNDLGCGYGALLDHLPPSVRYCGYDISDSMLEAARQLHAEGPNVRFLTAGAELELADYTVASGIFNVKVSSPTPEWITYMTATVDRMASASSKGFAFNALTSYADVEQQRGDLCYADPSFWFDYCKRKHSRSVALLHDYPLWEFTILVRR